MSHNLLSLIQVQKFPFLIFLLSLLGLAHAQDLVNTLLDKAATTLPHDAMTLIKGQILPIVQSKASGAFTEAGAQGSLRLLERTGTGTGTG